MNYTRKNSLRNMCRLNATSLSAIFILAATASSHSAVSLTEGEFQVIGNLNGAGDAPGISVTSGSEGYSTGNDGLGVGGLDGTFNDPILDYAFYTTASGSLVESLGGAASLISIGADASVAVNGTPMNIWAGSSTAGAADQTFFSRPGDVSGTVDISGLTSGSLYIFFGTRTNNSDTFEVTFTLTGPSQTPESLASGVIVARTALPGQRDQGSDTDNAFFAYRADFADAADYDTLTYTYDHLNSNSAIRSRFVGTVLTGALPVPEPTSSVLLGLGGLALILRRRK